MPSNTPCPDNSTQSFRVTHPFHPLCGRLFALVTRRHSWDNTFVYFHDDQGQLCFVPVEWTDLAPIDPVVAFGNQEVHFRLADLLELRRLLDDIGRRP